MNIYFVLSHSYVIKNYDIFYSTFTDSYLSVNYSKETNFLLVFSAYLSNLQGVLRGKIAKRTDERVKVMSELVNGVQVIKMYAWEKPFEKLVDKLRK